MTENVLQIWPEILSVLAGAFVLFVFALAISIRQRPPRKPAAADTGRKKRKANMKRFAPMGISTALPGLLKKPVEASHWC